MEAQGAVGTGEPGRAGGRVRSDSCNYEIRMRKGQKNACYVGHLMPGQWTLRWLFEGHENDAGDPNTWIWRFRLLGCAWAVQEEE